MPASDGKSSTVAEDLRDLAVGMAKVEGALETQSAMLQAHTERVRDELTVLFGARRSHETRIQAIEVNYVAQSSYRPEHEALTKAVGELKIQMAKVMVICALLSAAAGGASQVVVKMLLGNP